MIKQIQLRGISHRPSDRMTSDGGVEDCIDLRLEDQEHGPATAPEDVTETLAPGLSQSGISVLYIHKTNAYTNYVGTKDYHDSDNDEDVTWLAAYVKVGSNWEPKQIHALGDDSVISITSVGNMLVYTLSDGKMYYAFYKDENYIDLGIDIPRPSVSISPISVPPVNLSEQLTVGEYPDVDSAIRNGIDTLSTWQVIKERADRGEADFANFLANLRERIWANFDRKRKSLREDKTFSAPVLVRYAVKLYDGSYVHISEPVLLSGGGSNRIMSDIRSNNARVEAQAGTWYWFVYEISLNQLFGCSVMIQMDHATVWSELIDSVDIFMSTDVLLPAYGSDTGTAEDAGTRFPDVPNAIFFDHDDITISFADQPEDYKEEFLNELMKKANFYKVASYSLDNLPTNDRLRPLTQDELVVRDRMEDGEAHSVSGIGNIGAYNNRLVTGGQLVRLSPGHYTPHAAIPATGLLNKYSIFYHVRDTDGKEHIVQGYSTNVVPFGVRAYVSYPDPNCYQADLYIGSTSPYTKVILPMKEHPRLNCAYGFWGLDQQLDTPVSGDGRSTETATSLPTENPTYTVGNRLALSEMDNPFVFPLGQRERFTARILQVVPATIALSANQSGPFPLYIFTEDGIWAESVNAEGGLSNKLVVSRDVAVEGTITQLDRAIVFVSGQGVMYLNGMQVSCLSPYMNGPQWTISDFAQAGSSLRTALTRDGFGSLLDISVDTTDFQDFVQGCKPLYDYGGKRILFFNGNENYGYEYALDTQTWHRLSLPGAFVRTLNAYPDALAVLGGEIYNWSVLPDYNAGADSRKGIILTRPFDLDAPDIRKSIRDIRIRGRYNRENVKYLLFGSFDGLHWQKLLSLRGGSYKLFRMMILADLEPEERISWIDVDFEQRFADKLR